MAVAHADFGKVPNRFARLLQEAGQQIVAPLPPETASVEAQKASGGVEYLPIKDD